MSRRRSPYERGFRQFWVAETISVLGSQITELALPLTAVLLLHATPAEMGLLTAIGQVPFLVVGLFAGLLVDRFPRRWILVVTNLGTGMAVTLVPLAALTHVLAMPQVYIAQFILGAKEVVASVAAQSFIPSLVGRSHLVQANARVESAASVATVVGPGLGGVLVQVLSAPIALLLDAASYFASAALLAGIRADEAKVLATGTSIRGGIEEGLRLVLRSPLLRPLTIGGAIHNFFSRMIDALFVLYAVDSLGLGPADIGVLVAAGGLGAMLGAVLVTRFDRRVRVGPAMIWLQVLTGVSRVLIPLAPGAATLAVTVLAASNFLLGLARTSFNVLQVSLRVAVTPDHLHGRANGSIRFLMRCISPLGAVGGGLLASTTLGLQRTLLLAALGVLVAALPFLSRPLRSVREIPDRPNVASGALPMIDS